MLKTIAMCLVALFMLVQASHANPSDPQQCLSEISRAIDEANLEAFENLVDIDNILAQGADQLVVQLQNPEMLSRLNPVAALMLSGLARQNAQGPRNLLIQELHNFIGNGIASGAFAGNTPNASQSQGLLAPLFADASIGRKEIRNRGEAMQTEAGWIVPFAIYDYGNGNTYPVIGRFTDAGSGLQLTNIENMDQIFQQILNEAGM